MANTTETLNKAGSRNAAPHGNIPVLTPKIDPNAPAGSKTSLGAESIRDGRPSTGSEVVEGMDEEGPGIENAHV